MSLETMPRNAQELFDNLLPFGIQEYPDEIRELDGVFLFKIEGRSGGEWYLDAKVSPPTITKTCDKHVDVTIEMEEQAFTDCIENQNAGVDAYFENKIKIQGDLNIAMRLNKFWSITYASPYPHTP